MSPAAGWTLFCVTSDAWCSRTAGYKPSRRGPSVKQDQHTALSGDQTQCRPCPPHSCSIALRSAAKQSTERSAARSLDLHSTSLRTAESLGLKVMTLHGRDGSLEAAAQEFSAEQIAQLASQDAMRRVVQLQAQLEALQRENEDLMRRPAGSAAHRGSAAELGALKQEVAELRSENASLRERQGAAAVQHHQVDPVLQSQLAALRRENAALRAQRLLADRLGSQTSSGNRSASNAAGTQASKAGLQDNTGSHPDVAAATEEVGRLQRLLEQANGWAHSHESEAKRLAAEVRLTTLPEQRLCLW